MAGKSILESGADERRAQGGERLLLWHWGRRGGGPRFTLELARAFEAAGMPLAFSLAEGNAWRDAFEALPGPRVIESTYASAPGLALALLRVPAMRRRMAHLIAASGTRCVVSTMPHLLNFFLLAAVKRNGARFIATIHDATPHPGDRIHVPMRFVRAEAAAADAIVTLSSHVRDQVARWPEAQGKPIAIVPHGVFGEAAPRAKRRAPGAPLKILFLGRLLEYKGLHLLTEAFRRLRTHGIEARLTVLGQGDASLLGNTNDLDELHLDNRWASDADMQAAAREADAIVLPYTEASQSGVVALAMGAATPVVATRVGGLAEQVIDGETGLLVAPDAGALAEALARLAHDADLYARLSEGAARHAATTLSWDAIAAVYVALARGDRP